MKEEKDANLKKETTVTSQHPTSLPQISYVEQMKSIERDRQTKEEMRQLDDQEYDIFGRPKF